jgi:phosphoribosyl 1,2-cyclic phosphodiesterase
MKASVQVLASGSSGNATLVACGETRILIDAGVSAASVQDALGEIGERASELAAVILTHAHTDHVWGLAALKSRWPRVPVLATAGTAKAVADRVAYRVDDPPLESCAPVALRDVRVVPFAVSHDAADTVGFRIDCGDFALGVATDLGASSPLVESMLLGCRVLIVEANHDEDMLRRGRYPEFLQRRIASAHGHLSNRESAALLAAVAGQSLKWVILAHLSRTNNEPRLAVTEVSAALSDWPDVCVEAAEQFSPGRLLSFEVTPSAPPDLPAPKLTAAAMSASSAMSASVKKSAAPLQPRLFE